MPEPTCPDCGGRVSIVFMDAYCIADCGQSKREHTGLIVYGWGDSLEEYVAMPPCRVSGWRLAVSRNDCPAVSRPIFEIQLVEAEDILNQTAGRFTFYGTLKVLRRVE